MPLRIKPRSLRTDILLALLWTVFIAATGRSIEIFCLWLGASSNRAQWADDIFTGVVAGIVLLVALRNNSAKRRMIQKRLNDILQTNHHVRNALEVINSSHHAPDEESRLKMVADSVARIDKTLREFSVVDGVDGRQGRMVREQEETEKKVKSKNRA